MHLSHNTMKSDLASSALRIYLTHLLQQTEEVLVSSRFQMSISAEKYWQHAINAADELKDSILNCRQSLSHDAGFLCVVDSLQDALRGALQRARNKETRNNDYGGGPFDASATRAKYLTYGFTARDNNEHELSALWFLAAQNLQRRLELRFAPSITESLFGKAGKHLRSIVSVEKRGLYGKSAVLNERVCHHFRYAAALSALGRPHSHDYAAELYMKASDAHRTVINMQDPAYFKKDPSTPGQLVLLERAAAAWQLAAEMAAGEASNSGTLRDDPGIANVIAVAKKSAKDSEQVATLLKTVDQLKAAAAATKDALTACNDATMLPLLRDLAAKQEDAVAATECCFQSFIDGTIDADAANKSITASSFSYGRTASKMDELQQCNTKAAYYRLMATQALQGSRASPLASKCWTKAAAYIEEAAQLCVEEIITSLSKHGTIYFRISLADNCAFIAENVLGCAVEYMDKARGAEAGEKSGRDPREAQMWRKAAECTVQKAELVLREMTMREENFDPSRFTYSTWKTKTVMQIDRRALHYANTAEYLHLSFMHRAATDTGPCQADARVAVLYVRTAELMMRKFGATDPASVTKLVNQHLSLIQVLNESATVTNDIIAARELICEYGAEGYDATDPALKQLWAKASCRLIRVVEHGLSRERFASARVSAQLYASAARAANVSERLCFASAASACEDASCAGEDVAEENWSEDDSMAEEYEDECLPRLVLYHHVLAGAVLALGGVLSALPPGVITFLQQVQHESAEEGEMKSNAQEHAECIMLRDRCELQCAEGAESGSALDAWKAVQREVKVLLTLLQERAKYIYHFERQAHLTAQISFHTVVVKCFVAFAEAPPNSDSAAAWGKAVKVCEKSDPSPESNASQAHGQSDEMYSDAAEAVKRAMDLARVQMSGEAQIDA